MIATTTYTDPTTGYDVDLKDAMRQTAAAADASRRATTATGKYVSKPVYGTSTYPYQAGARCDHWRAPMDLEGGLVVYASAWTDSPVGWYYDQDRSMIDVGFYCDDYWTKYSMLGSPNLKGFPFDNDDMPEIIHYPWPDRKIPDAGLDAFVEAVDWLLNRIKQGQRVDVGCFGGHGRTGTVLACLLIAQGVRATDAIARVRATHCDQAIETAEQVQFIRQFDVWHHGEPAPWERDSSVGTKDSWLTDPQPQAVTIYQGNNIIGEDQCYIDGEWIPWEVAVQQGLVADDEEWPYDNGWTTQPDDEPIESKCIDGPSACADPGSCNGNECLRKVLAEYERAMKEYDNIEEYDRTGGATS